MSLYSRALSFVGISLFLIVPSYVSYLFSKSDRQREEREYNRYIIKQKKLEEAIRRGISFDKI